jgi:hypothetical protein
MGIDLDDPQEVLFRQIHPSCLHDGEPASDQFKPRPSDDGLLSVDRSALITAAESHTLYTGNGRQSAAVYGVTVDEFSGHGVSCVEDPLAADGDLAANPAHAVANFASLTEQQRKTASKRLKRAAVARGCLHP